MIFGDVLKVNYIIDARVKGRVTFRSVAPIAYDQILPVMEVILRVNGVGVVEEAGLYRILPLSEVSREPASIGVGRDVDKIPSTGKSIVQIIPILYLQSSEVVKLITPFLSANAVVVDIPKSNQIIVVDTDANVKRMIRLVDAFDSEQQKRRQVQVYVYPVQNQKAKDIANLLQQIFLSGKSGSAGSAAPPSRRFHPTPGRPECSFCHYRRWTRCADEGSGDARFGRHENLCRRDRQLHHHPFHTGRLQDHQRHHSPDRHHPAAGDHRRGYSPGDSDGQHEPGPCILGQGHPARGRQRSYGHSWRQPGHPDPVQHGSAASSSSGSTVSPPATTGFSYVATDDQGVFRFYLDALSDTSKGKLLAAPHILVSDNREARIQVGQQVPIVTSSTVTPASTTSGTVATQTIQYKDIGIILKIKPQVNESGLVALELSQEVSTYSTITLGQNETDIILNKTEASTNLVVQDGHTIVIGGLIRQDDQSDQTGVPFLNKIPILGYLFGTTSKQATRQELIILLTPHVIRNQQEAQGITSKYIDEITGAATSKGGLKKGELLHDNDAPKVNP